MVNPALVGSIPKQKAKYLIKIKTGPVLGNVCLLRGKIRRAIPSDVELVSVCPQSEHDNQQSTYPGEGSILHQRTLFIMGLSLDKWHNIQQTIMSREAVQTTIAEWK